MNVETTESGTATVLRLEGDLDEQGINDLRTALYDCMCRGHFKLVVNLREVRFISYMGLGVLVERLRKIRALSGDIKLVGINLYAERLFRMVGVSSLFDIYDSEAQAVNVYQEAA